MRELTRCIAWTVGLGALALLFAAFAAKGLAQVDGPWAWLVFLLYSPFYLLGHAFSSSERQLADSTFEAAVFAAQFLYFLAIVAGVRYLHRSGVAGRRGGRR